MHRFGRYVAGALILVGATALVVGLVQDSYDFLHTRGDLPTILLLATGLLFIALAGCLLHLSVTQPLDAGGRAPFGVRAAENANSAGALAESMRTSRGAPYSATATPLFGAAVRRARGE